VAAVRQKHLVLILAREFAANLATPTAITDEEGRLIYFNEAAEEVFGQSPSEVGEMDYDEWTSRFSPRSIETDEPLPIERRPTGFALREQRASHERLRITTIDGIAREISVTAFPLYAHPDELVGTVTIFWRD
jgi:PAS domain S-box-containing protein